MRLLDVQVERLKNGQTKKASIAQVTLLSDFKFFGDSITANRYSGIGVGEEIEEQYWKGKDSNARWIIKEEFPYRTSESYTEWSSLNGIHHIGTGAQLFCEEEETEDQQETGDEGDTVIVPNIIDDEDTLRYEEEKNYYDCPGPVCVANFLIWVTCNVISSLEIITTS